MAARRSKSRVTIDHDEMRRWVESKGGCPASVKGTGRGDDPGVLRIDFPGYRGVESLQRMSWNEWFKWFDKNKLAFVYDPHTRFSKLVSRDTVADQLGKRATPGRAPGAKRATLGARKKTAGKKTTRASATTRRGTTTARRPASRARGRAGTTTTSRAGVKRPTTMKRPTAKRGATKRATKTKRATTRGVRVAR